MGAFVQRSPPRLRLEACRQLPVQHLRPRRPAGPALGALTNRYGSDGPDETEEIGARLAADLRAGDVVTVSGELGSGKTTFVRGACRALGVEGPVTSPTFTIGHRYHGRELDVSHLDLYRFTGVSAAEWGDLEPYFDGAIAFVEWPEAGAGVIPPARFEVRISYADGTARIVTVADADPRLRHGN